jgi:hypothetical protein
LEVLAVPLTALLPAFTAVLAAGALAIAFSFSLDFTAVTTSALLSFLAASSWRGDSGMGGSMVRMVRKLLTGSSTVVVVSCVTGAESPSVSMLIRRRDRLDSPL